MLRAPTVPKERTGRREKRKWPWYNSGTRLSEAQGKPMKVSRTKSSGSRTLRYFVTRSIEKNRIRRERRGGSPFIMEGRRTHLLWDLRGSMSLYKESGIRGHGYSKGL